MDFYLSGRGECYLTNKIKKNDTIMILKQKKMYFCSALEKQAP